MTWENKHHHTPNLHPFLLLPPAFNAITLHCTEDLFFQLGSAVPGVSPPYFFFTPSLLSSRVMQGVKRPLGKLCTAGMETSLSYQCSFQHKCKVWPNTTHCEENYVYPPVHK